MQLQDLLIAYVLFSTAFVYLSESISTWQEIHISFLSLFSLSMVNAIEKLSLRGVPTTKQSPEIASLRSQ
jgi:hypothetical protein